MLSLSKRVKKNGDFQWQATIRVQGQKSVSKTFETWDAAHEFGEGVERELLALAAKAAEPQSPPDLLAEDLGEIVAAFAKSKRAAKRHPGFAPTVIKQVSGVRVGEVRARWVEEYVNRMQELPSKRGAPYSCSSISSHLILMSLAIRWRAVALDVEAPAFPPYVHLFPEDHDKPRDRRLAPDEGRALLSQLSREPNKQGRLWCLLVLFAIETAARLQELMFANSDEFQIFNDKDGKEKGNWRIPREHTKTRTARDVPLSDKARRILRALRRLQPNAAKPLFIALGTPRLVSKRFAVRVRRAGIVGFRFHDLRHEGASRLALRNPDKPYMVMRAVGHSDMSTFNGYVNILPEELLSLVD
ncbi:tyrosine-type recombinase/integrase [Burkholderia glumae]|uniref:tyrosine-type recombinase/integrase n=1 Tax=Burkholderia glumae TaxID=337 RepID=UPI00148EC468|nr:site-specific integrase [Burkholderia glumae]QJW80021.1 site-specific integrase [Burkholderia glumae]